MDGSTVEHSDSDSGESWTLLENHPTYGDVAPEPHIFSAISSERENIEAPCERDDDTDGISIITDSDPESIPCEEKYSYRAEESTPLLVPTSTNSNNNQVVKDEKDFLGDNIKYKTYVHKRNPKVGTILDIIMLGTFVITAGMALGHLWSCKNECTTHTSVNKILSNLYKLQEENAFLRNKLKEITMTTGYQLSVPHKSTSDKYTTKQHRCKKIFEEPVLKNRKAEVAVKCVDDHKPDTIQDPLQTPTHEKEFLNDINKMKDIYDQNKNWLDKEVKKKFDNVAKLGYDGSKSAPQNEVISHKQINLNKQLGHSYNSPNKGSPIVQDIENTIVMEHMTNLEKQFAPAFNLETYETNKKGDIVSNELQVKNNPSVKRLLPDENIQVKKITYADSLKIDQPIQRNQKSDTNGASKKTNKDHIGKRKQKHDDIILNLNSFSEDDIIKDDRYTGPKFKHGKKKHDRQKSHKKQKRYNKYEQWEMKGGYLKDYDEFSVASSQDNNDMFIHNADKKFENPDFENYINKLTKTETLDKEQPKITKKFDNNTKLDKRSKHEKGTKIKDSEWYDKRTALRAEARIKLEQELFGQNTSNNAAWYFRRMHKREQCRAQKGNSTFKKLSKRKMNYKMKR